MALLAGSFRRPSTTATTARPAGRWRWPRRSPGWVSATPVCTSRTPTPTRSPAGCKDFRPDGLPRDEPMVPHGMAVSLTAPEAFRFTFEAAPERHLRAAACSPRATGTSGPDALPSVLTDLMRDIAMPNGLAEVGYGEADVDDLVDGTMKQQRLLATAPREVTEEDAAGILGGRSSCGDPEPRTRAVPGGRARLRRGTAPGGPRRRRLGRWPGRCTPRDASLYRIPPRSSSGRGTPTRSTRRGGRPRARDAADDARRRHLDRRQRGRPRHRRGHQPAPEPGASTGPRGQHRHVQPGVVHAALQNAALPHGLRFGPDPSTHTRCTIGGMIGNNACGSGRSATAAPSDNIVGLAIAAADAGAAPARTRGSADEERGPRPGGRLARRCSTPWSTRTSARSAPSSAVRPAGVRLLAGAPAARERPRPRPRAGRQRGHPGRRARRDGAAGPRCSGPGPGSSSATPTMAAAADAVPAILAAARRGRPLTACEGLDAPDRRPGRAACRELPDGRGWLFVELAGDNAGRGRAEPRGAVAAAVGRSDTGWYRRAPSRRPCGGSARTAPGWPRAR